MKKLITLLSVFVCILFFSFTSRADELRSRTLDNKQLTIPEILYLTDKYNQIHFIVNVFDINQFNRLAKVAYDNGYNYAYGESRGCVKPRQPEWPKCVDEPWYVEVGLNNKAVRELINLGTVDTFYLDSNVYSSGIFKELPTQK